MRLNRLVFTWIILLLAAASVSYAQTDWLTIIATTTQAADLAAILTEGVDGVEVVALMGAGVDPHLYQPTEADVRALNRADLVVYNGLNLEGQFGTVFAALGQQGTTIVSLGEPVREAGFTLGGFDLSDELVNVDDPHIWFDPRNWQLSTTALADALAALDPDHADVYTDNAEAYSEQLDLLFAWAVDAMASVPEEQRTLVTSHDAFQYFGDAVGWALVAIQGLSTEDEAGVADVQSVVREVVAREVPVLFVESSIAPATIQAVVEAVRDQGASVQVGVRALYSDAMGTPGTFGGTYIGMFAENVYTILQSYACAGVDVTIPEWPEDLEPTPPAELLETECTA